MIAKCVALLAVVAQINCYAVNGNCGSSLIGSGYGSSGYGTSGYGSSGLVGSGVVGSSGLVGSSGVVGSSGLVGSSGVVGSSGSGIVGGAGASTRNIVAKGKYPVALSNTGPVPDSRVPVSTSHVQAPVQQKPTIRLPANIPNAKVIAHSCSCYKQILRPRVHDQYISVPSVQRYIETIHKPVVENIHYEAVPVNDPTIYGNSGAGLGGELASSALSPVSVGVGSGINSFPVSAGIQSVPITTSFQGPISSGFSGYGCNGHF